MALKFGTSGIRGLNTEFTPTPIRCYVKAFLLWAKEKTSVEQVALAIDLRESSPGIRYLIEDSLRELGSQPIDCGALPTPALALYCAKKQVPGIMITGSHIPADRNGIKFYWPWGEILKADEMGIMGLYEKIAAAARETDQHSEADTARELYLNRYIDFFSPYRRLFEGKTVVVYQHSAVSRDLWKPILRGLGFEVLEVGRTTLFTPVDTETEEAAEALRTFFHPIQVKNLFAVVSSDGDADRPFLCDEKLQMIRGDTIGILSATFLKASYIVTPVSTNTALEKTGLFKTIRRTKIGSPFVIEAMSAAPPNEVVVGFEANGGLLLGSDITRSDVFVSRLPTRDSILPILSCLALAAEKGQSLSELVTQLPQRFTYSDLLREFPVAKKEAIYQATQSEMEFQSLFIHAHGGIEERNDIDGLRFTFADGNILHFRPSGNAPEFRCYAESDSLSGAKDLVAQGIAWLKKFQ